jgi:hypothetical protein
MLSSEAHHGAAPKKNPADAPHADAKPAETKATAAIGLENDSRLLKTVVCAAVSILLLLMTVVPKFRS